MPTVDEIREATAATRLAFNLACSIQWDIAGHPGRVITSFGMNADLLREVREKLRQHINESHQLADALGSEFRIASNVGESAHDIAIDHAENILEWLECFVRTTVERGDERPDIPTDEIVSEAKQREIIRRMDAEVDRIGSGEDDGQPDWTTVPIEVHAHPGDPHAWSNPRKWAEWKKIFADAGVIRTIDTLRKWAKRGQLLRIHPEDKRKSLVRFDKRHLRNHQIAVPELEFD